MRLLLLFILLIGINTAKSQNLVPNPSFEDTVNCNGPFNCCTIEIAYPWFNPNTATSDFFSNYSNCGYPTSEQIPRTGNSYGGFFGYLATTREYIEVKLDTSLMPGQEYCLKFFISRNEGCGGATDRIGAFFSIDSLLSNNPSNFNLTPHIESTAGVLLTDTAQWILIEGTYIAQGGENFLTIGNFRDTSNCIFQSIDTNNFICTHAYYNVDDVYLGICDSSSAIMQLAHEYGLSLSNSADHYIINFMEPQNFYFEMYNLNGVNLSYKCDRLENQVIIKKNIIASGIYILRITYKNSIIHFKIII